MGKTHKITIGLITAATLGLIGWDIYVATNGTLGDTISAIVLEASKSFLIIPVALGGLMGHLFCPRKVEVQPTKMWAKMAALIIAVVILDIFRSEPLSSSWTAGALFFGIAAGHLLWPNWGKEGE